MVCGGRGGVLARGWVVGRRGEGGLRGEGESGRGRVGSSCRVACLEGMSCMKWKARSFEA